MLCTCIAHRHMCALQTSRDHGPAEIAQALLTMLDCISEEAPPNAAVLTAISSGMFSQLAAWAIQIAWRPTNLLVRRQAAGPTWRGSAGLELA